MPYPGRISNQSVLRAGIDFDIERETFAEYLRAECVPRALDQAAQRERCGLELDPSGLDLREVEDIIDDAKQRPLSLLRTPNHGEDLEIFASPPYRRGHDHDSFGPGFPALLPGS